MERTGILRAGRGHHADIQVSRWEESAGGVLRPGLWDGGGSGVTDSLTTVRQESCRRPTEQFYSGWRVIYAFPTQKTKKQRIEELALSRGEAYIQTRTHAPCRSPSHKKEMHIKGAFFIFRGWQEGKTGKYGRDFWITWARVKMRGREGINIKEGFIASVSGDLNDGRTLWTAIIERRERGYPSRRLSMGTDSK